MADSRHLDIGVARSIVGQSVCKPDHFLRSVTNEITSFTHSDSNDNILNISIAKNLTNSQQLILKKSKKVSCMS